MNTIGTSTTGTSYRAKYFQNNFQEILRRSLVSRAICNVDESGSKYIHNPYSNTPTALVQALAGTYSVSAFTLTDDSLTVTDEFTYGEHVYDFEEFLTKFSIMSDRMDKIGYALKAALDIWAINELCANATGTMSTPAGGLTTAANWPVVIATLTSKVAGYDNYTPSGLFLVIESGDIVGLQQVQFASGFSYADAALNNGLIGHMGGVDIYVVLASTFADATTTAASGSKTWTNAGHRVGGIKKVATLATNPARWEEKGVTGKTGKEVCGYLYAGFKLWTNLASLVVDVTVTS